MSDEGLVAKTFVYAGKRLTVKGQLVHAWIPEGQGTNENEVRPFPKAKGTVIGGKYTIEVNKDSYKPTSVTYTGERAHEDIRADLDAADRANSVTHARQALERNHARESEIKELCQPLREIVGRQVGWANRAALIAYITSEISRN